jgi:hypothetical protein
LQTIPTGGASLLRLGAVDFAKSPESMVQRVRSFIVLGLLQKLSGLSPNKRTIFGTVLGFKMDAYNTQPCAQTCANAVLLAFTRCSSEISRIFQFKPSFPGGYVGTGSV